VYAVTEPVSERSTSIPPASDDTQAPVSTKPLVSKQTRKSTIVVSVIVTVVVLAILIGLGYLLFKSYDWVAEGVTPATVRLRDIAFVVMALETLIVMVLILIIVVLLVITIVLIYDRVIPALEQLNRAINTVADTVHTVRGTTTFVGEKVVSPLIEVSSYAAGAARIVKGILDLWPWKKQANQETETAATEQQTTSP
jgi:hypothetical protein